MATTEQALGTLQYDRPRLSTTNPTTLKSEYRLVATTEENELKIQQYLSLDPVNVAQETTITITAGIDGDLYDAIIDDGTVSDSYSYRQSGAMTADELAIALAKRIDLHPGVRATVSTNVITVLGVIPGVNITFDESNSTTPGNLAITTPTAASGTPLHRLISETTINWTTDTLGFAKVSSQSNFYNGDEPPTLSNAGALYDSKSSVSLDSIQTANGIDRAA